MQNSPQRQKADLWLLEGSREGWGEGLTKETFWEGCIFSPFWLWWLFHVYQDSPSCLSWMESLLSVDVQFIACPWYLNKAIEIFKIPLLNNCQELFSRAPFVRIRDKPRPKVAIQESPVPNKTRVFSVEFSLSDGVRWWRRFGRFFNLHLQDSCLDWTDLQ